MTDYRSKNAYEVLNKVERYISLLEVAKSGKGYDFKGGMTLKGYTGVAYCISAVYDNLSIFDWWNEDLSLAQLKSMRRFLKQSIKLGFTGYVCFKVGAAGCAHGMWAFKNQSTDGYSPDGDCLYHSFRSGDNYWDGQINGVWMHEKYATEENSCPEFTYKQIKAELEL